MVASSYIQLINIRMYVPIFMSIIIIYVDHFLRLSQILNFYVPEVFMYLKFLRIKFSWNCQFLCINVLQTGEVATVLSVLNCTLGQKVKLCGYSKIHEVHKIFTFKIYSLYIQ